MFTKYFTPIIASKQNITVWLVEMKVKNITYRNKTSLPKYGNCRYNRIILSYERSK